MRGGNQGSSRVAAALCVTLGIYLGCAPARALAATDDDCGDRPTNEKSIVVSTSLNLDEPPMAIVTDGETETLQPIATVSDYEPELAEPPAEPTLAEPIEEVIGEVAGKATASDSQRPVESETVAESLPATGVISFHGIVPGSTRRGELLRKWGQPQEANPAARVLSYQFERIPLVRATLDGDVVESLLIKMQRPLSADELAEKLGLLEIRPAVLFGDANQPLAEVFPERGVLFRYQSDGQVVAVVIQPSQAEAYLLRVENNLEGNFTENIADVEEALRLDHRSAYARWLLSKLYLKTGQAVDAERLAAESVETDPENTSYRLQWAKCLRQMARYDLAVEQVRTVLESTSVEPIVRAQSLHEMGLLASIGSKETAQRAAPLHNKAIEIADDLASSEDHAVSQTAKLLLIDAHLAMAQQIAQGEWSEQEQIVPQWVERASALSESLIAEDERHLSLRLRVAVSALAATASMDPPVDPQLWILEAEQTAEKLSERTDDALTHSQIDWQLGLVYFYSAQIEYRRGKPSESLQLADLADEKMARLATARDEMPDTSYLLGDLYFQMGAVHAVHYEDHHEACEWYALAATRMLQPVPVTTIAAPRRHGDALVSMGVSYWHTGQKQRAIDLTQAGVDLIEQAVGGGLLAADSLLVPYGNLAAMYEASGEETPASKYTQLASKIDRGQPSATQQR